MSLPFLNDLREAIIGVHSREVPYSIKIKSWYEFMVGSKYFQTAVLFSVYGLIAESDSVIEQHI